MKELAPGLFQLRGFPPNGINVFLMGDVLVDAGTRHAAKRILRQLEGRTVTAHALTHAHPDHQGASHEVCTKLGLPFWAGEQDADAAEDPRLIEERQPKTRLNRVIRRYWTGPGHPVDRQLREGDVVAGFTVLDVPGHSAGHVAYWRESDRVLVVGDVLNNMNVITGRTGLYEPKRFFTPDPERNRESIRRVAALGPELVCFGHGAPLRDPAALAEFAAGLPA
jgi:hydroxyacylglutathione hydrolase